MQLIADLFFCALLACASVQLKNSKGIPKFFVMPVNQLRGQLGVRFFSMCYCIWPGVGILARKIRLVMDWHSFLSCQCSFFLMPLLAVYKGFKREGSSHSLSPIMEKPACWKIFFCLIKLNLLSQNRHC